VCSRGTRRSAKTLKVFRSHNMSGAVLCVAGFRLDATLPMRHLELVSSTNAVGKMYSVQYKESEE
jgi:hypothetical protein